MNQNQQELLETIHGEYQNLMNELNTISFWNADKYKQLFDMLLQISLIRSVHASEDFYEIQLYLLKELPEYADFFQFFRIYIGGELINWDNFYLLNDSQKLFFFDKTTELMIDYISENFKTDKKIEKLLDETNFLEVVPMMIGIFNTSLIEVEEAYGPISVAILEYQKNMSIVM